MEVNNMCTAAVTKMMTREEEQEMLAKMTEKERDTYLKVNKLMGLLLTNICGYSEEDMNKFYADEPTEKAPEENPEVKEPTEPVVEETTKEVSKVIIDSNVRVPETKTVPITYDNGADRTIQPTIYVNENGELAVGKKVEEEAEDEDHHVYDDVDYVDEMELMTIDNSALLEKYKELKPVETAIRQLKGFDVLFKEDKNLIQANVFIGNTLVAERSFIIDLNGCMFSDDYKWFPCLYPSSEAMGYESYPALEMDMDVIKKFVSGEFIKDKTSIKSHSLCSEDEIEVNRLFDLATLPAVSAAKRKVIIKTLFNYMMDDNFKNIIYSLQKKPRFIFKEVKSEKSFTVISKTGNEYNYGSGNFVEEEYPLEIVFSGNKYNVLPVAESGK